MIDISENPFAVHSPDALDEVPAQKIVDLFVAEHTKFHTVKERKHTFIWGPRGSGKSFMLRYLEPQCQFIEYGSAEAFFDSEQPFLGIYTPCKKGEIDKTELDLLDDRASQTITEHLLNLTVAEETVSTLSGQIPEDYIETEVASGFAKRVVNLFDSGSIASSRQEANSAADIDNEPFKWLNNLIQAEKRQVAHYLRQLPLDDSVKYKGATSGYHDFLLPMMRGVQELIQTDDVPVFIFIDDAYHLNKAQQEVVNTWIANRDQGTLCVKVSSSKERYETFNTTGRGVIEATHDYTEIDFEELYTHKDEQYAKKIREIIERRLELSDVPTKDVDEFFPRREYEEELLEDIRKELKREWREKGEPQSQSDYISRYANARLFQKLAEGKTEKKYSGFDEMVHISSGVIRNFLDPCQLMFNKVKSEGKKTPEIEEIPPSVQHEVLKQYSQDFLLEAPEKMKKNLPPEKRTHLDDLTTLIRSLGKLFYERLHNEDSREPRMFSFTIRGEIPPESELNKILELGRRMQYFTLSSYSSKEGGGREDWYILNRRLAPMFKLDPTGFQGRISLTPEMLELGCKDKKEFVRRRLSIDEDQQSLSRFEEET